MPVLRQFRINLLILRNSGLTLVLNSGITNIDTYWRVVLPNCEEGGHINRLVLSGTLAQAAEIAARASLPKSPSSVRRSTRTAWPSQPFG